MPSYSDYPELIEPIPILVEIIDKTKTPFSTGVSGKNEIINHVVRTPIQIMAQVVFGNTDEIMKMTQLGADEQIKGYVVLRLRDLELAGKEVKRGDRIVKLKNQSLKTPLYFVHSLGDLFAHFSNIGMTLTRLAFSDREPVG
jgi:type II secretory pathway component PulC